MCVLWLAIHRSGPIVLWLRQSQTRRTNTARVRRSTLEQRILAEIEVEILSDEALERLKTGLQSFFGHAKLSQQDLSTSPRLAKLDEEAEELRALVKKDGCRLSQPKPPSIRSSANAPSWFSTPRETNGGCTKKR